MRTITSHYIKVIEAEWVRFMGHIHRKRWWFRGFCLVFGTASMIYGFSTWRTGGTISTALALAGGVMIGAAFGDIVSFRRFYKRLYAEQDAVYGEARAITGEQGITVEGKTGLTSTFPWNLFSRVEDLGDCRLLYVTKEGPLILLRRAHSEEDWVTLGEWIDSKVNSE